MIQKKGQWSLCRFIQGEWGDEWQKTRLLLPIDEGTPVEATPTWDTAPVSEGVSPLAEPARPQRERHVPDRYSPASAAVAAMYAGSLGVGYTENWSRNLSAAALHVDTSLALNRLMDRAVASVGVETGTTKATEVMAAVKEQYEAMPPELQRCACIMMDHDQLAAEYGKSSPQAKMCREVYAAAMVDAARSGLNATPLEPLYAAVGRRGQRCRTLESGAEVCADITYGSMFDDEYDGNVFVGPPCGDIDMQQITCAAKAKSSPLDYGQPWSSTGPRLAVRSGCAASA